MYACEPDVYAEARLLTAEYLLAELEEVLESN